MGSVEKYVNYYRKNMCKKMEKCVKKINKLNFSTFLINLTLNFQNKLTGFFTTFSYLINTLTFHISTQPTTTTTKYI